MKSLRAPLYEIEPVRQAYHWENDECTVKHIHEPSFDAGAPGEVLLVSPHNRIRLPDGTNMSQQELFSYEDVRDHVCGFRDEFHLVDRRYHLRDLAYYNVAKTRKGRLIDSVRSDLKHRGQRYFVRESASDEQQSYNDLLQTLVSPNDFAQAIEDDSPFPTVIKAAVGVFWGSRAIMKRGIWSAAFKERVKRDGCAIKNKLCTLFAQVPPLRFVESAVGERLIYVEDAQPGDVAYVGIDPSVNEFLAEMQPLHNFANPVAIQSGDVIREPGFIFGPVGGQLWQAGFDLARTTVLSDYVHRPKLDFKRMGLRIDTEEVELFRAKEQDAQRCGSVGDDEHRHVHLMSNMAGAHPIEMCAVHIEEEQLWPAMFSAVDGRSTYPATVTVTRGTFEYNSGQRRSAGQPAISLQAGRTYLLPHKHARSFALFGLTTPAKAIVTSARLMIPHL